MPGGTFLGAGVKTVVLFFDKGQATKNIWYYQMNPGRNMGKTNALNDSDMEEFVTLFSKKPETEKSWNINFSNLDQDLYDLSVKNPNLPEAAALRAPEEILAEMETLDADTTEILQSIKELI
jgi:type I restriction enzyme M protein